MTVPNTPGSPFDSEFSAGFGTGTPTSPPVSAGALFTWRADVVRVLGLINPAHPVQNHLAEAVRILNAVHATMGHYS